MKKGIPSNLLTADHDGHALRSGRHIVDRQKLTGQALKKAGLPNQYTGHTFLTQREKFRLDGHKLLYHLDRVRAWQQGERIAPIQIDMGLTKFCNMKCSYCIAVTQGGMKRGQLIKPKALLRFVEDCGRLGVRSIAFIGDGEPTLNPALTDAVVLAGQKRIDTGIATNALILDPDRAGELLQNCSFIRINLSAANETAFSRIHGLKGRFFSMVVEKVRFLVELKRKLGAPCTLGLQMVLIPENFDQILPLAKLGRGLGVDYFQVKQCSDTEYGELGIHSGDYALAEKDLAAAETMATDDYQVTVKWNKINIAAETDIYRQGCRKYDICHGTPFLGQISGNGKVYPCGPFFGKERFCMGDINRDSYYDIVRGDNYWQIQRQIRELVDVHRDCTIGCRQDYINKFLWDLMNPPQHINFI